MSAAIRISFLVYRGGGGVAAFNLVGVLLQSWARYMGQALVSLWNRALREKFNFHFLTVFACMDKIFILAIVLLGLTIS